MSDAGESSWRWQHEALHVRWHQSLMGLFLVSLLMTHMLLTGSREQCAWNRMAQKNKQTCGKKMSLTIVPVSVAPLWSHWGSFFVHEHWDISWCFLCFILFYVKCCWIWHCVASTALTGKILSSITEAGFEISALQMVSALTIPNYI